MPVHTYLNLGTQAEKQANLFRTILAVDIGYSSEIAAIKGGFRVTASDGKFVDFMRGTK